jgi:hypothetical protein
MVKQCRVVKKVQSIELNAVHDGLNIPVKINVELVHQQMVLNSLIQSLGLYKFAEAVLSLHAIFYMVVYLVKIAELYLATLKPSLYYLMH